MNIPKGLLTQSISPQDVLIFTNNNLNSPDAHLHICIAAVGEEIKFVVSGSDGSKVKGRIAARGLPVYTAVDVPDKSTLPASPFNRPSCIDCNHVFSYTKKEFEERFGGNYSIAEKKLPDSYFQQIVSGICMSPLVEQELIDYLNGSV